MGHATALIHGDAVVALETAAERVLDVTGLPLRRGVAAAGYLRARGLYACLLAIEPIPPFAGRFVGARDVVGTRAAALQHWRIMQLGESGVKSPPKPKKKFRIAVNYDWCKACYICIKFCPVDILKPRPVDEKVEVIDQDKCIGCMQCELHCPDFAIEVIKDEPKEEG